MASQAAIDAQQYAEALRRSLMEDLFDGEDLQEGADEDADEDDGGGPGDDGDEQHHARASTDAGARRPDQRRPRGGAAAAAATAGDVAKLLDASAGAAGGAAAGQPGQLAGLEAELEQLGGHEVIRSIIDQGCVLAQTSEGVEGRLRGLELESIQDYIAEGDNLVGLHDQIVACDTILAHMESLLGRFQADLSQVSEEIRSLQVQSAAMSTRLRNRRAAEDKLGTFLEQALVSEDLIATILDAPVDEEYLEALLLLGRKIAYISSSSGGGGGGGGGGAGGSVAAREVAAVLEKLRVKAISKVRDFMLAKLSSLRKPKTNVSIIQQNVLLKYKYCPRFLEAHGPDVAAELRGEYVATMSRLLSGHFRTYLAALEKMEAPVAGPTDVLGVPDGSSTIGSSISSGVSGGVNSMMALFGAKGGAGQRGPPERVFELGSRGAVLSQVGQPALVPHMAEAAGQKLPYEVIFRNVHSLLVDTASSEFLFCLDFWQDEGAFRELFGPVVGVVEADLAAQLQGQHDVLCVLLMIRLNGEHRALLARRRVPCLDDYLDRVDLLLWPRFKVLFDQQAASIRQGAERSLFSGAVEVAGVTRRYAALAASCLTLMADHDSDDSVFKASSFHEALERLWAAMFDLLLKMSNMFKDRRQGIIFLILNYNHIKATLRAADSAAAAAAAARLSSASSIGSAGTLSRQLSQAAQQQQQQAAVVVPESPSGRYGLGPSGAAAIKECEDQLSACMALYVEDQLGGHFRGLLDFVKRAEQAHKRSGVADGAPIPGFGPPEAAPVLADFRGRWKASIEAMHREVVGQVEEPGCAREVLQASMTQLLLYYTRMLELLKRQGPAGVALVREAVNIPAIMYEIKAITKA